MYLINLMWIERDDKELIRKQLGIYFATLSRMKIILLAFMLLLISAPLNAADLGAPKISDPFDHPVHFFDQDSLLTNGGVKYFAAEGVSLEPELGIGYWARNSEMPGWIEHSTHRLHAQAGWRLSLADTLYLSAAAKLPMVTVESSGLYAGEDLGTRPPSRQDYDFTNPTQSQLAWTGEMGIHLSPLTDLTVYYDKSPISGWYTGGLQQEERIGTRFILRFK